MAKKLSELDSDFRAQHLIEGDDALEREQETLDTHDNLVTELSVHCAYTHASNADYKMKY